MTKKNISSENWEKIFGKIDFSAFTEAQLHEIHVGLDQELPAQLYADPVLSPKQMHTLRTMLETAREAILNPNRQIICTDYGPEELTIGFKSWSNFEKYPQRICYIPENWDFEYDGNGYTGAEILSMCDGDHIKARMVFSLCDWQHPSTILGEWDRDDDEALLNTHKVEAAQRISAKTGLPIEKCEQTVAPFSYSDLVNGYYLKTSVDEDSIPPGVKYIEPIYQLMKFDNAQAAYKQAEKDGIKLIHDMEGIEDRKYLDTPQNRTLLSDYIKHTPRSLNNMLKSAKSSTDTYTNQEHTSIELRR